MNTQHLSQFLDSVKLINWFEHAGEPIANARLVHGGLQNAWDGEGKAYLKLWKQQSYAIEARACETLTDPEIDNIFAAVSEAIHDSVYRGICSYLDRVYGNSTDEDSAFRRTCDDAVFREVMDSVKRDFCWAAVEDVIKAQGFFTELIGLYREGRWPCSWDGQYPNGQPVVI